MACCEQADKIGEQDDMNKHKMKKATGKEVHLSVCGRNTQNVSIVLYDGLQRHIGTVKVTYNSIHILHPNDVELKVTSLPIIMLREMPPKADKIATFLKVLKGLEEQDEQHPMAKKDTLFQVLCYQFDFSDEELKAITRELLRNGTIYEPRQFYLKVT